MTAHRARAHSGRYQPAPTRPVPAHLSHLHPDWLPPGGYHPDGTYADPADDLDPPASGSLPLAGEGLGERSATAAPYGALPWIPGSSAAPPDPDHPEDEDAIFRNPILYGSGRERQLSHTALPLRHRIYALHCQGRSISAIARSLRLDRGTVARHLHATEDLLLAEETHDLARLRLRAVEAQHAVLAAAWDALLCEELNESDASNEHPYPSRRAQLLATAARAARTAAQLQGLFTPAALQAALAATQGAVGAQADTPTPTDAVPVATPDAPAAGPTTTPSRHTGLPGEVNSTACPSTPDPTASAAPASGSPLPRTGEEVGERAAAATASASASAASCGMPAIAITTNCPTGLPHEFNSTAGSLTTRPALTTPPAPASPSPAHSGEGLGAVGAPLRTSVAVARQSGVS